MPGQQQHVLQFRKYLLRKRLLRWSAEGAAYVPFIGDGDLARLLYLGRPIYGADLDPDRVANAAQLPGALVREADCDLWPFPDVEATYAVADFDAYVHPYRSFRAWWEQADKARVVVCFFTDGHKQGVARSGVLTDFLGNKRTQIDKPERRAIFNHYLSKHVWPAFDEYVAPWRRLDRMAYLRGQVSYWGIALEAPSGLLRPPTGQAAPNPSKTPPRPGQGL